MIKSSSMKIIFLIALIAVFLVTWTMEMKHYSYFDFAEKSDTIEDMIVSYFTSFNTSLPNESAAADNKESTFQFLFEASSNLSRVKNAQFSPVAYFYSTKSAVCLIPKNGHSVVRFVNCLLAIAESKSIRAYQKFNTYVTFKGAFSQQCNNIINSRRRKRYTQGFKKVVFIRDPLERFISGWLFICKRKGICFNCGQNFHCFLTTLYNCWKSNLRYSKICRFSYVTRHSKTNTSNHLYWHLSPQASFCHLHETAEHYQIIEYSKENVNNFLLSTADSVLESNKLEDLEKRLQEETVHAAKTNDSLNLRKVIASDKKLASMFAQLYFVDYETFGINLPQFIIDFKLYENG